MPILEGWAEKGELARRAAKEPTEGKVAEGPLQRSEGREMMAGSTVAAAAEVQERRGKSGHCCRDQEATPDLSE